MPVVLQHSGDGVLPSVEARIQRSAQNEFILVVPTKRSIRHLSRNLIHAAPRGVAPALPLHTLESLAQTLFAAIAGPRRLVAGPVQTLLFHDAVMSLGDQLGYFTLRSREPRLFRGTFEKIIDVILHLKESGVYPATLDEELAAAPLDERLKLRDIASIYRAYDAALDALQAVDQGGIYKALHIACSGRQFTEAFRALFPHAEDLLLAGFDEFAEPEMEFIRKICAVDGLTVTLMFDFLRGNRELFGHLEENFTRFLEMGFVEVPHPRGEIGLPPFGRVSRAVMDQPAGNAPERAGATERAHPGPMPAIEHLAHNLFGVSPSAEKHDLSREVTIMCGKNRTEEVELVCKLLRTIVAERPDRDLSALCVAMVRPENYTDVVREFFPKFGIPVNITDRFHLSRSPLVIDLLGLLQIPVNNFRRTDLLRVARSPYFHLEGSAGQIDPGNLAAVSQRLRINAGEHTWERKIEARLAVLSRRRDGAAARLELGDIEREEAELQKARADVAGVRALLSGIAREGTPRDFRRGLVRLFEQLQVPARLVHAGAPLPSDLLEKDVRAYAKLLDVIEESMGVLEFQESGARIHPLKFYVEALRVAVLRERYNVREKFGAGVLVTSIEETRGLPMDAMIVMGLVDGEFPSVYEPEVFLSTQRRKTRERRHAWQNRYLFYQAATNWSEHLYLTYPEKDGEIDLVRSSFIDALVKTGGVREWKGSAAVPFARDLFSEEELLRWYGKSGAVIDGLPEQRTLAPRLASIRAAGAVEMSRLETHTLPEYEGVVSDKVSPDSRVRLAQLRDRTFSISQLETYAACPYRYFAQRMLRLRTVEDVDEGLTPQEKGIVLHEALFEFYTRRRDAGLPALPQCTDREFADAADALVRIAEEKLNSLEIPDVFWDIERELILGHPAGGGGVLRRFLDLERSRRVESQPRYFEVGFGGGVGPRGLKDNTLSTEDPVEVGGIKLQGKVDRIEVGEGFFTIVDYKTGRTVPGVGDIRRGISLQLPLYLRAVEMLLHDALPRPPAPAGGLYYLLKEPVTLRVGLGSPEYKETAYGASRGARIPLKARDELREIIDLAMERAAIYVEGIAQGRFPLTSPENIDKICVHCPYSRICRIQTVRHVSSERSEEP